MMKPVSKTLMILGLLLQSAHSSAQTKAEKGKVTIDDKKKKPLEISTGVYNKVAPAVVKIECDNGNKVGSGTIVGLTGRNRAVILTACHVVAVEYDTVAPHAALQFHKDVVVRLATDTSTVRKCEILGFYHLKKDLALIATRDPVPEKNVTISYNFSKHAGPGSLVAAMGFPDSEWNKLSQTVGNIKRTEGGYLVSDAHIAPGSSGGPLIDKFGRMVGMSRFTFEDEGYATPFDSLSTTVDRWLKRITAKRIWEHQKYGNFGQKMTRDWRFLVTELAAVGTAAYFIAKPPVEPDLPGPPGPP